MRLRPNPKFEHYAQQSLEQTKHQGPSIGMASRAMGKAHQASAPRIHLSNRYRVVFARANLASHCIKVKGSAGTDKPQSFRLHPLLQADSCVSPASADRKSPSCRGARKCPITWTGASRPEQPGRIAARNHFSNVGANPKGGRWPHR